MEQKSNRFPSRAFERGYNACRGWDGEIYFRPYSYVPERQLMPEFQEVALQIMAALKEKESEANP